MRAKNYVIIGMAAFALLGCEEEQAAAPVAAAQPGPARVAKPAETAVAAATGPAFVYSYNPVKRDPFRVSEEGRILSGKDGAAVACNEPLCAWDVEQLTLVAVVTGDANPIAMVEDPSGKGHIIRRATRVGRQGGKVTQILRDQLTVTAHVTGPDGQTRAFPQSLRLKADASASPVLDMLTGRNYGN